MLTLTLPNQTALEAETFVYLAAKLADHRNGPGWESAVTPFEEHDDMCGILEELALIDDGAIPGYVLTGTSAYESEN